MLVIYSVLGLPMARVRSVIAFITGIAGGIITNNLDNEKSIQLVQQETEKESNQGIGKRLAEVFRYGFCEMAC